MSTGTYSKSEFCPKCGVRSILRDNYCNENGQQTTGADYICLTCGFGFKLSASLRHQHANALFKEHRKIREK